MSKSQVLFQKARFGLAILAIAVLASGCMSPMAMALSKTSGALDLNTKSIALFTLRTSNQYKPTFQPRVRYVEIVSAASGESRQFKTDPSDIPNSSFRESMRAAFGSSDPFYEYLISVDVEPGTHTLKDVMGVSFKGIIQAGFGFPVNAQFTVPARSVTYVGHVDMVNRERKKDEPRSGSVVPLVDQAVAGFSGGTFDVTLSDRSESDIPLFTQTYPCLRDMQIGKSTMKKSSSVETEQKAEPNH